MFVMRRAKTEDVPTLLKLAKMVHFINLPADKDIISDKATWSRQCFQKAARNGVDGKASASPSEQKKKGSAREASPQTAASSDQTGLASAITRSDLFMFVLEDTESKGVLGTSQIITKMGGPGHPNVSFELRRKEMFSKSLQVGATHTIAQLVLDETGPTEIGGLILQPSYRGHKAKLGRFLSLVRFHFIGLYPHLFSERVIAEMMGPLTPDGRNTLWEYLGRRFINLTYPEADSFCQYSKEFMISLLPREEIYLTLLPPEARSVIAEVGPETVPARRMLEKLGFAYKNRIDPFDGGPMLECDTKKISIVRGTERSELAASVSADKCDTLAMVSVLDDDGEFRCVNVPIADLGDAIALSDESMALLNASPGMSVGVTRMERDGKSGSDGTASKKKRPETTSGRRAKNGAAPKPAVAGTKPKRR